MKQVYFKDKTLTLHFSNSIKAFVPQEILTNKKLSAGARLLYAYIFSLPSGWICHLEKIGQELGISKNSMSKYFKEILLAQEHQVQQLPLQAKVKDGIYATDFTHLQEEKSSSKKHLFTITNEQKTYLLALAFNPFLKRAKAQRQHQTQNLRQIKKSQNLGTKDRDKIISKENKNNLADFVAKLEHFSEQEKEAITSWLTYKKERAKKGIFTLEQIKRQIAKILALKNSGENIITCIHQSLEYGWLGLFATKAQRQHQTNVRRKRQTQEQQQALQARLAKIQALKKASALSGGKSEDTKRSANTQLGACKPSETNTGLAYAL